MHLKTTPPKGARLTPVSKEIIAHLHAQGRQTFDQLHVLFKEPAAFRSNHDNAHIPNPEWLRKRLVYLREAGHVSRELHEGAMYYVAAYQPEAPDQQRLPAHSQGDITPPRRSYVMGGPPYSPPRPTPCRSGALDFASLPSVMGGRKVPFKTELEANNG